MSAKFFDWKEVINKDELCEVIRVLDNDGVIIFPTDTVYGLACNCFSEKAIDKIFGIKNRVKSKPINVLTNSVDKIHMVVDSINEKEKILIEKYMPGALTIIFNKNNKTPKNLTANLNTIGVRIPDNEIALKILGSVNYPLATTSANLAGENDGIEIKDLGKELIEKVDIIIDGGVTKLQEASAIVRVDAEKINILREGTTKILCDKK